MLNEVTRGDVPLHHFSGHEVVICKEGQLRLDLCKAPGCSGTK